MLENIFQPFDRRLIENKILPWWEILRAILHAGLVGLLTFTLTMVDYDKVVCVRNGSSASQYAASYETTTTANFVNSICQNQLNWYCRHLVLWVSCIVILHILAEKWWLAFPKVKSAISALGELHYINGSSDQISNTTELEVITTRENCFYCYRCIILMILDCVSLGVVFIVYSKIQKVFIISLDQFNSLIFYCYISNEAISDGKFLCVYNALDIVYLHTQVLTVYLSISMLITLSCEWLPYGGKFVENFYENSERKEVLEMKQEIAEKKMKQSTNRQDASSSRKPEPTSSDDNKSDRRNGTKNRKNKGRYYV